MSSKNVPPTQDFDLTSSDSGATLQEPLLAAAEVKKRSLQGATAYILRTVFLFGLSSLSLSILGAKFSPAEYGIYGIVVTISSFFTIISDVGLAASLIQQKEEPSTEELRTVFTIQQVLAWIVFVLVMLSAVGMMRLGKLNMDGVYVAFAFAISFPIVCFKTISSILLERSLRFEKLVIPAIAEAIVFNVLLIFLVLNGHGLMSYVYAVILRSIIGVFLMYALRPWKMGLYFSKAIFFDLMKIGTKFQLNDMLAKTKDDIFYLTLAVVISPTQYGYITWAKQWSRLPYTLTVDNITAITFPAFSRLQHDKQLLRRAIEKTIYLITLLAFPLFAGLAIMVIPFTVLVPAYAKWQPALLSLGLFSFSLAFSAFSTPLVNILNAMKQVSESLKMMIFWTSSQWLLFPILFPIFSYQSVPIIAAILGVSSLYMVRIVKKFVEFNFTDQIWRQTVATIAMSIVLFAGRTIWQTSFVHFGLGIIIGGVVFLSLCLLLGFEKMKTEVFSLVQRR